MPDVLISEIGILERAWALLAEGDLLCCQRAVQLSLTSTLCAKCPGSKKGDVFWGPGRLRLN